MSDVTYHVTITIGRNPHAGGRASYGTGAYMATAKLTSDRGDAQARGVAAAGSKDRAAALALRELLQTIRRQASEERNAARAEKTRTQKHQRELRLARTEDFDA